MIKGIATRLDRHPIWTATGTGVVFALFLQYGTVPLAAIIFAAAVVPIWRGSHG